MTNSHRAADPGTGWLDGALVLAVLGLAGLLGCAIVRNSDIWMHLATGRLIANGQYQFGVDPFSYATANDYWVNHAWAFDLGLYWIFAKFGGAGVVLMRCAVVLVMTMALIATRRPSSGFAVSAIVAVLALVSANLRLPFFQPAVHSYMDLAILMWLLHAGPRWRRSWLFPAAITIFHSYWVNHDSWFFLGPCVIALWTIGTLFMSKDESELGFGYWFGILVCAMVGCLLNPHHIRAFVVPDEIVPSLRNWSIGGQLYFSPFDAEYRQGQPGPVVAASILFLLGVVSFIVNLPRFDWRRFLLWGALAIFGMWRSRLVPFFAIGTAPIVVLNLQEALARLQPSSNLRLLSIASRAIAILLVIGLGFAAWPGWLGPNARDTMRASRVALRLESNPALERLATRLGELQASGQLNSTERSFSPSFDVANYLAWYAPSIKSFIDTRWRLHSNRMDDFTTARKFFSNLDAGQPANLNQLIDLLKPYDITLLLINGSERSDSTGAARVLFTDPERWPWIALAGKATAFVWNSQNRHPTGINVGQRAFAPQAPPPLPPPPDDELKVPTAWDLYVKGPRPRPIELDESLAWLEYTDAIQARTQIARWVIERAAIAAAPIGDAAWPLRVLMEQLPFAQQLPPQLVAERFGAPLLALREARAALASNHESAEAAYRLAQAYSRLASFESLLALQRSTALVQARARLEILIANKRDDSQLAFRIANDLAEHYARFITQRTVPDVFVEQYRKSFEMMRRPSVVELFSDQKSYEAEFNKRKKQLEALEKALAAQREQLRVDPSANLIQRIVVTDQSGFPGEAMTIFQSTTAEQIATLNRGEMIYVFGLMLRLGLSEDARTLLNTPLFDPITSIEPQLQPIFRQLHLSAALACGDMQRARDEFYALLEMTRSMNAQSQARAAAELAAGAIAIDPTTAPVLSRWVMGHPGGWGRWLAEAYDSRKQRFEFLSWQALLALEFGDTRTAKRSIDEALEEAPRAITPIEVEILTLYQILLDRAAQAPTTN